MRPEPKTEIVWESDRTASAVIRLPCRMEVLSSAPLNGGRGETDTLFIMQVPHDFSDDRFAEILDGRRRKLGLPED